MQFEHWKALKAQIISETADVVNGMYAPANFSVEEAAEVFRKVLEYPINQPELKLDGLPNLLPALYELLVKEAMNKNIEQDGNFTLLATHFESYLKKIMYLINHPDNPAINPVLALAPCISKLGLNPNKINYNQTDLSPNSKNNFAEHLWRAYNIRNDEAHYYPPKNRKQFWTAVQSYLVMYLYAAFKYRQAILQAVEPYFLTTYLQNYLTAYQNWNNEYVAIPGIEFVKIEQWVTEVPDTERDNRGETNPDAHPKPPAENRPQPTQERRSGTIEELSKTIAERQMVLVAEPGMGKTTALQYLAFLNAQNIENGDNQTPYPVMIELKEFQKEDSIPKRILQKLGIYNTVVETMLQNAKITLLLDGLNEVGESLKNEAINSIKRFMQDYPKVFVLITTRPNAYERNFFDNIGNRQKAPIFQLQEMDENQIAEFLLKNSTHHTTEQINQAIQEHEALKNIIRTPLLLKMLIAQLNAQPNSKIPPTETDIILGFLNGVCHREHKRDAGFNARNFMEQIGFLAHQTRMRYEANATIDREELLNLLELRYKRETAENLLAKAVELRLLTFNKIENRYSFVHELYQEALWAKQQSVFETTPPPAQSAILYSLALDLWYKEGFKQALRLYSGLLQADQRLNFVREISKRDIVLAARCIKINWKPEPELTQLVVDKAKRYAAFFNSDTHYSVSGFLALLELNDMESIVQTIKRDKTGYESYIAKLTEAIPARQALRLISTLLNNNLNEAAAFAIKNLKFKKHEDALYESSIVAIKNILWERKMYKAILQLDCMVEIEFLDNTEYLTLFSEVKWLSAYRKSVLKFISKYVPDIEYVRGLLKHIFYADINGLVHTSGFPLHLYPLHRKEIVDFLIPYLDSYIEWIEEAVEEYKLTKEEIGSIINFVWNRCTYTETRDEEENVIITSWSRLDELVLPLIEKFFPEDILACLNKEILKTIQPNERIKWIEKYNLYNICPVKDCIIDSLNYLNYTLKPDIRSLTGIDLSFVLSLMKKYQIGIEDIGVRYFRENIDAHIYANKFNEAWKIMELTNQYGKKEELVFAIKSHLIDAYIKTCISQQKKPFPQKNFDRGFGVYEPIINLLLEITPNEQVINIPESKQAELNQHIANQDIIAAKQIITEYKLYLAIPPSEPEEESTLFQNEEKELFDYTAAFNQLIAKGQPAQEKITEITNKMIKDYGFDKTIEFCLEHNLKPNFNESTWTSFKKQFYFIKTKNKFTVIDFLRLIVKPSVEEITNILTLLLENSKFEAALLIIQQYPTDNIVVNRLFAKKSINEGHFILADKWVELHDLRAQFPVSSIIEQALQSENIFAAKQLRDEYRLEAEFPTTRLITVGLHVAKNDYYYDYDQRHLLDILLDWIKMELEVKHEICNEFLAVNLALKNDIPTTDLFRFFEDSPNLNIHDFVEKALTHGKEIELLTDLNEKYELGYDINEMMVKCILNNIKYNSIFYSIHKLIEECSITNRLTITLGFLRDLTYFSLVIAKDNLSHNQGIYSQRNTNPDEGFNKYQITEAEIETAILYVLEKGYPHLAKPWVELVMYANPNFPLTNIVQKALDHNEFYTAKLWVYTYNLHSHFPQFPLPAEPLPNDHLTLPPPTQA